MAELDITSQGSGGGRVTLLLCLEDEAGITSSNFFTDIGEGKDDKKGHSCLVGVGKVLLKLSNMEVSEGSLLESSMIAEFRKSLHVWWPK